MTPGRSKARLYLIIFTSIVLLGAALICLYFIVLVPDMKYHGAIKLLEQKKYEEALEAFEGLDGYRNSEKYVDDFFVRYEKIVCNNGESIKEYAYDEDGNVIKKITTDHNDNVNMTDYIYDGNGNVTKEFITYSNGSLRAIEYTFDKNGRMIKKANSGQGWDSVYEYIYDDDGLKVKEISTNQDGISEKYDYYYDANKNLVRKTVLFIQRNNDFVEYLYMYDGNGNLISEVGTRDGEIVSSFEYSYDSRGNKTKVVSLVNGSLAINEYSYDENDRVIKDALTTEGSLLSTDEYVYDKDGNVIQKKSTFNRSGYYYVTEYTYDEDGFKLNSAFTSSDGRKSNSQYGYSGKRIFY